MYSVKIQNFQFRRFFSLSLKKRRFDYKLYGLIFINSLTYHLNKVTKKYLLTNFCASRGTGSGDIAYLEGQDENPYNFYKTLSRLLKPTFYRTKRPNKKTYRFSCNIFVRFISEIDVGFDFRFIKSGKSRFSLEILDIFLVFLHRTIVQHHRRRLIPFSSKSVRYNSTFNLKGSKHVLEFYENTGPKLFQLNRYDFLEFLNLAVTKNQTFLTATGKKL